MERNRVSCWHFHFLAGNVIIADNWLIIHNFNRLTNQRAGKVLRHQKVLRHRVAFLKVLNWSDFLILPLPDFAKGCRLFNSLWGFESHCVTWTVMRTWQIKILCTTCARVRFPFLDFYFPCCRPRTLEEKDRPVAWFPSEWSVVWITAYTRIYANSSPFRAIFEVC